MPRQVRQKLLDQIQAERKDRLVIAYITSTRPGAETLIADDAFRLLYDHLQRNESRAKNGVDLFLHSNGGSGTVPWRIVSLIRQYADNFAVLVPHHAFSAATLIALGADEIVMHRMGVLGPIDPSVANIFNPPNPQSPGQLAPISVEDVTAFFRLVREEAEINHEDEVIQALLALTDKVHPLALGNVQRHQSQSKMMARKLLKKHMKDGDAVDHDIDILIEKLKSGLFFHGHPINRDEAKDDLKLKVVKPSDELEKLMWDLYLDYETEMKFQEPFNPARELELAKQQELAKQTVEAPPLTTQAIVQQLIQMAKSGLSLGCGLPEAQMVNVAAAILSHLQSGGQPQDKVIVVKGRPGAYLESSGKTHVNRVDLRLERVIIQTPGGPQEGYKQEVLWQRWEEETA